MLMPFASMLKVKQPLHAEYAPTMQREIDQYAEAVLLSLRRVVLRFVPSLVESAGLSIRKI